jgi:hypothetical protein
MILNQLSTSDYGNGDSREDRLDIAALSRALGSTKVLKKLRLMMPRATASAEVELIIEGVHQCESLSHIELLCYDGGFAVANLHWRFHISQSVSDSRPQTTNVWVSRASLDL